MLVAVPDEDGVAVDKAADHRDQTRARVGALIVVELVVVELLILPGQPVDPVRDLCITELRRRGPFLVEGRRPPLGPHSAAEGVPARSTPREDRFHR